MKIPSFAHLAKSLYRSACVVALLFALTLSSQAQSSRGVITGIVQDASGAAVVNAEVTLKSPTQGTAVAVKTNSVGLYRFEGVNVGDYTVVVSAAGFSRSEVPASVAVGATVGRDFQLQVGSDSQTIEVTSNSLELQTEDAVRGSTLTAQQIAELPLAGLNSLNLILTNPGVARSNQGGSLDTGIGSVNGARARSNNFLIDGLQNNDISVAGPQVVITNNDELAEVNFQTSNFSPEFGRAGGAVVSQVTKSGTNQWHGTLATEYRSSYFNASTQTQRNAYASNLATYNTAVVTNPAYPVPQLKPKFHDIYPAATIGGPLVIPHFYNGHDRTFIFGAGQMDRYVANSLTTFSNVPTAAGIATLQALSAACPNVAFYLNLLSTLGDPRGSSTGVGVNSVDISVPTASLAAAPTCNGTARTGQVVQTGQYYRFARDVYQDDNFLVRVDHRASSKQDLMFRFLFDDSNETLGGSTGIGPQFDIPFRGRTQGAAFTDVYQFRNNLINEFRFGFVRSNQRFDIPAGNTLANTLPAYSTGGTGLLNIPAVSASFNQGRVSNNFEYEDVVTYIRGHHAFKVGAEIQRQLAVQVAPFNGRGTVTFTGCSTTTCAPGGISTVVTGAAQFIDNYAGVSTAPVAKLFDPVSPGKPGQYRPNLFSYSFFVQDSWKISPDLSLVYGVRYENFGQPANGTFNHPAFVGFNSNDYAVNSKVDVDNNNLGPTFGFSYQPHYGGILNGRTVIRGGYQVTYDTFFNNLLSNMKAASPNSLAYTPPPSTSTATTPRGVSAPAAQLTTAVGSLNPYTSESSDFSQKLRNPYYHHFSFGVQEQLPGKMVLDVAYVGSLGRQLFFTSPLNPAIPNATLNGYATQSTAFGTQTLRLNPLRGTVQLRTGGATSNYHSAQVQLRHRGIRTPGGTIYFTSSYTYSKSLDVISETFATNSSAQNPSRSPALANIRDLDYGPSDNDRRHISSTVINWSVRSPSNGLLNRIVGGFSIAPILTVQSGTPFTVLNGADRDLDGSSIGDRADIGNKNAPFNSRGIVTQNTAPATTASYCASGLYNGAATITATNPISANCTTRDQVRFVQVTGYNPNQTQGRNSQYTTRYLNLDTNVLKKIKINERFRMEVRATLLNITNNQNFDTPSPYTNITTYGNTSQFINSTLVSGGSRTMRLGAKILF